MVVAVEQEDKEYKVAVVEPAAVVAVATMAVVAVLHGRVCHQADQSLLEGPNQLEVPEVC